VLNKGPGLAEEVPCQFLFADFWLDIQWDKHVAAFPIRTSWAEIGQSCF